MGDALGIYNGISSGTATGDASAAINAGKLLNQTGAFGGSTAAVGSGLGVAGAGLGVYGGIQQGGAYGYASAADNAAQAGAAAGVLPAAVGAWASGIGGILGTAYTASQPAVQLMPSYWNGVGQTLSGGYKTDPNTANHAMANDPQSQAFMSTALELLNMPQSQVPQQYQQMIWDAGLIPAGTWGMSPPAVGTTLQTGNPNAGGRGHGRN